jgi:uncharacterized membrane protein YdjX (TVP38/TMEM64 family)
MPRPDFKYHLLYPTGLSQGRWPYQRRSQTKGILPKIRFAVLALEWVCSTQRWLRYLLLGLLAMILMPTAPALAQTLGIEQTLNVLEGLQQQLLNILAWIDGLGTIAPIVFILLYIAITVALLPASIVTLGAGVVFGIVKGTLLVFTGAMLGATAAFLVGRYLARDWVAQRIAARPKFQAIDTAIAQEGRKVIFLLRLSPFFPFNLLNYGLGLSQVSLPDYVLGTFGILPGTILYVYLGSLVGSLALLGSKEGLQDPQAALAQWIFQGVGLLVTLAVTFYITRVAQQALKNTLHDSQDTVPDGSP